MTGLAAGAVVRWHGRGGEIDETSSGGTTPEQLFSAALAKCLTSTLTALAREREIPLAEVETAVRTHLDRGEGTERPLSRTRVSVRVRSPAEPQTVHALVLDARDDSPLCNAIAGKVPLLLQVSLGVATEEVVHAG